MDLNRISIVARERTPWEAIDLGFLLAREWYRPLLLGWIFPSLFCFILFTVLFHEQLWLGVLITWWLKPIWDRIPLFIASRALFGEEVSVRKALRLLPSLSKTDWFAWLTWRRLSLTRSFDMPVTVLEGLKGDGREKRLYALHLTSSSPATWLTIVCINLETALVFGALGLIYLFIPEELDINYIGFINSDEELSAFLLNIVSYVAMVLVAPFYTMAGFSLYISRRISLEAWDIEIRFRQLVSRQRQNQAKVNERSHRSISTSKKTEYHTVLAITLLFSICLFNSSACFAEFYTTQHPEKHMENDKADSARSEKLNEAEVIHEMISTILNTDDFGHEATQKSWRFKEAKNLEENETFPDWLILLVEKLERIFAHDSEKNRKTTGVSVAFIIKLMLSIAGLSILLLLIYYYRTNILKMTIGTTLSKKKYEVPTVLFGMDVRKESVPKNVPEQVLVIWRSGFTREALGLLYRATLSKLIHHYRLVLQESDTEMECENKVKKIGDQELNRYFQLLTSTWQRLAYGHSIPDESEVVSLCKNWGDIFHREN